MSSEAVHRFDGDGAAAASPWARLAARGERLGDWLAGRGDGFWAVALAVLGLLIYLPRLGAYPLWDPWEPHYSQVAWEMAQRDTWVNPWYRGVDNWWSKPILMLWMLRASLGMLWDPAVNFDDNLIAARLPFALFAVLGGLLSFDWTRRLFGRAVAVLSSVVLITGPQYVLLGRQVIVDIPFVATYAASMGYLAVGLFTPRPPLPPHDAPLPARAAGWLRHHGPFAAFWALQAVSMLAKGFVPPTLAVMVLVAYAVTTFRWRDYPAVLGPGAPRRLLIAGAGGVAGLGLTAAAAWAVGRPQAAGLTLPLQQLLSLHWRLLGAVAEHLWLPVALARLLLQRPWRSRFGRGLAAVVALDCALRAVQWWLPDGSAWQVVVVPARLLVLGGGAWLAAHRSAGGGLIPAVAWTSAAGLTAAMFCAFGAAFAPVSNRPASGQEVQLYQVIVAALGVCVTAAVAGHALPPVRHGLALLRRLRTGWGLALFFAVGAPWFIYMSYAHGWPYWNEWLFYHHLGRAAGTIDKPGHTFNYFVLQIGAALFPWSGLLLPSLLVFVERCNPWASVAARRNLFVLLSAAVPYLFFTLSGTKFAHYIFPVVPFAGLMVAAALVWLGRGAAAPPALAEELPAVGPPVPAHDRETPGWWKQPAARGTLVVFTALALLGYVVLSHDLVLDFRLFLRLFIYYANRATPPAYDPFLPLQVICWGTGAAVALSLLTRWVGRAQLAALGAGAVVLACYISWVMLPAMGDTFSYGPFLPAYERLAKPGEEIGQYNDWQQPERSVIFLFQNRCKHLRTDSLAAGFLKRPGRKFIIVDQDRLADLRRVARGVGQTLTVVFDGHPYAKLVSNQPGPDEAQRTAQDVLAAPPPGMQPVAQGGADFEGKIRLLGWETSPARVRPGEVVHVTFYYRCDGALDDDWQIFVHGDAVGGAAARIHGDHFPLGGNHPTTAWKVGDVVRDTFDMTVPRDYDAERMILWTGWYRGDTRLKVSNAAPSDGDNRVRGPEVWIDRP